MPTPSETLKNRIQELAQLPLKELTPALKNEYKTKLHLLLFKELHNQNGYADQAKEALEYFAESIGITPRLVTLYDLEEQHEIPKGRVEGWIQSGMINIYGRRKGPGPGGGKLLVSESEALRLNRTRPGTGRSWSRKRRN